MGDLRPLGSEKLQGMDKIQRILEIARFKENIPTSINETSKSEYNLTLADGRNYQIIREKAGYIIKQTISENAVDYIVPIQDRTYFKSYSQALKRLNLMAKEMNAKYGNDGGTSLFSEQKKYVLKTPDSEKKNLNITDDVENVPPPAMPPPAPAASDAQPAAPDMPNDDTEPMGGDESPMGGDDFGMGDDHMTPGVGGAADEAVSFKIIQKLTGKLGQKLRALNANEENKMTSKDIKYVINSVLSALNLDELSDEDKESIMNKFEGVEAEEGMNMGGEEMPSGDEEMSAEPTAEPSSDEETSTELGEDSWDDASMNYNEEDDDMTHIGNIADSIFMENKVEDVLMKYYRITESEKKYNQEKSREKKKITRSQISSEIQRLSETPKQELRAKKFLTENSSAKLIGKTNKKNLVFELNDKQFKISLEGSLKWSI